MRDLNTLNSCKKLINVFLVEKHPVLSINLQIIIIYGQNIIFKFDEKHEKKNYITNICKVICL